MKKTANWDEFPEYVERTKMNYSIPGFLAMVSLGYFVGTQSWIYLITFMILLWSAYQKIRANTLLKKFFVMEQDIINQNPFISSIKRKVIILDLLQVAKWEGLESTIKVAKEKFSLKIRKEARELYEKEGNRIYLREELALVFPIFVLFILIHFHKILDVEMNVTLLVAYTYIGIKYLSDLFFEIDTYFGFNILREKLWEFVKDKN